MSFGFYSQVLLISGRNRVERVVPVAAICAQMFVRTAWFYGQESGQDLRYRARQDTGYSSYHQRQLG